MAENNTYEEARKRRLEENNKRFQDLGLANISKSLCDLTNSNKKTQQRLPKPKSKSIVPVVEPRRSSRARNSVSYRDDVDVDLPSLRKRSRSGSSWASYIARPIEECKSARYEERVQAIMAAEELQSSLESGFPSFVKSMVRSHVYSCFWLGLPSHFCKDHLPTSVIDMVLEDENGTEYDAIYIGRKSGLSGGWRAFALDHKLDDGDALVFELVEPTRFKVYIIRASSLSGREHTVDDKSKEGTTGGAKKTSKRGRKVDLQPKHEDENASPQKLEPHNGTDSEGTEDVIKAKKKGSAPKRLQMKGKPGNAQKLEPQNGTDSEGADDVIQAIKKCCVPKRLKRKGKVDNAQKLELQIGTDSEEAEDVIQAEKEDSPPRKKGKLDSDKKLEDKELSTCLRPRRKCASKVI